jgi:hypothetical protein
MKEVHGIAQNYHPGIEPWFCSWWWTPEEHAQFNAWADREAPGWVQAITMHIEYGQTRPKEVPVAGGVPQAGVRAHRLWRPAGPRGLMATTAR